MNVIAGFDQNDSTSSRELVPDFTATLASGVREIRVGITRELIDGLSEEVSHTFGAALRLLASSGAYVDQVSIATLEFGALINSTVTWLEALDYHERWLRERRNDCGKEIRLNLEAGMMIPALDYFRAQRGRARILAEALSTLQNHDVLVSPGVATRALKTIPTGIASDGLPTSMQIVERPFDKATVLRVASCYEAMRGPLSPPPI